MIDFSKLKALTVPEGVVTKIVAGGKTLWQKIMYKNMLPLAIKSDKTPYVGNNGEKGYKTGWRINSSAQEKEAAGRCCTGFIPAKPSDTIRIKNVYHPTDNNYNGYIQYYNSSFTFIGGSYESPSGLTKRWGDHVYTFVPNTIDRYNGDVATMAYFRISTGLIDENSIITVNEEIPD